MFRIYSEVENVCAFENIKHLVDQSNVEMELEEGSKLKLAMDYLCMFVEYCV